MRSRKNIFGAVYSITNIINREAYIGSTANYLERKYGHIRDLRKNKHHSIKLQNAWNKYGEENFIFEIIEKVVDLGTIVEREQYYLNTLKPYYNIAQAAYSRLGAKDSDETRRKKSVARSGVNNHNFGKYGWEHTASKPVAQFDSDGNLIKVWSCAKQAFRDGGFNASAITQCCRMAENTHRGYWWFYFNEVKERIGEDEFILYIKNISLNLVNQPKKVCQFDLNGNLIKIWDSLWQAEVIGGYTSSVIRRCCNNKSAHHKRFIWIFYDEYSKMAEGQLRDKLKPIKNRRGSVGRKVIQLTLKWEVVREWNRVKDVKSAGFNNMSVIECCKRRWSEYNGFIWRYFNEIIIKDGIVSDKYGSNKKKIHCSRETKNKIRQKAIGRKASDETKRKMSEQRMGENNVNYGKKGGKNHSAKKVAKYDKAGNLISIYDSIIEASQSGKFFENTIVACCKGKRNTHGGYIWKYVNQIDRERAEKTIQRRKDKKKKSHIQGGAKRSKRVAQFNKDGYIVRVWDSITQAYSECGFDIGRISSCCRGITVTYKDFVWIFYDKIKNLTRGKMRDFVLNILRIKSKRKSRNRKIAQLDLDGNIIRIWDNMNKAKSDGFCTSSILYCCVGKQKFHNGCRWQYADTVPTTVAMAS